MKKKIIRMLCLLVVVLTFFSTVALAAQVCPRCQDTRVSYCGSPYTTTQHTLKCATCNTSYMDYHYWVTENITYCSKCGYYW